MKQPAFARVLGVKIPNGPVFALARFSVSLASEVFGPPEIGDSKACWNFADANGKITCAIAAERFKGGARDVEMKFIEPAALKGEFFDWATTKLNLTQNADLAPAFLTTHRTALRVERL